MGSLARVFFLKRNQSLNFTSYVKSLFFQNEKLIEHKAAVQLVQLVDNHLFYIQRLSWHAFMNTSYLCNSSIVTLAFKDLLSESQIYLQNQLSCLTPKQYYYLQALTSGTDKMCSRENLLKYQLDRSSNVARIKENLLQKEVIEVRRKDVIIIDPLLKHWIDSPLQFKSRT